LLASLSPDILYTKPEILATETHSDRGFFIDLCRAQRQGEKANIEQRRIEKGGSRDHLKVLQKISVMASDSRLEVKKLISDSLKVYSSHLNWEA
jgi:hypothetical protein